MLTFDNCSIDQKLNKKYKYHYNHGTFYEGKKMFLIL